MPEEEEAGRTQGEPEGDVEELNESSEDLAPAENASEQPAEKIPAVTEDTPDEEQQETTTTSLPRAERTLAALAYAGALPALILTGPVGMFIVPLIILVGAGSMQVTNHARNSLNIQLTALAVIVLMLPASVIGAVAAQPALLLIAFVTLTVTMIWWFASTAQGTAKAFKGERYRSSWALPLLREKTEES